MFCLRMVTAQLFHTSQVLDLGPGVAVCGSLVCFELFWGRTSLGILGGPEIYPDLNCTHQQHQALWQPRVHRDLSV